MMPFCHQESPWQTSFNALVTYTIPRIEVNVSSVFQDKPNISTDQLGSLAANYTLTAADLAAAAAQIGRPLTATPARSRSTCSRPAQMYGDRIRQWDFSAKKIIRLGRPAADGGRGHLQHAEQQRDAGVQPDVHSERRRGGSRRPRT